MRAVVQRVKRAKVTVEDRVVSEIGPGLLTLLGVGQEDSERDVDWIVRKVIALRIFADDAGKMNRSLSESGGSHLIVSQFTLLADVKSGNRPSFIQAARPEIAKIFYERALQLSTDLGVSTWGGVFQASMEIELINDGPTTIVIDSPVSK